MAKEEGQVLATLRKQGFRFKKEMGQHFLANSFILAQIVELAGIERHDMVVEAGAGAGGLTEAIADTGARVVAVELDRALIPVLRQRFQNAENVEICHGDIMKLDIDAIASTEGGPYKICANLPYHISTPFVTMAFRGLRALAGGAILLQKEVADKVTASPETENYGMLALAAAWYGEVAQGMDVDARHFTPQPPVESAVVVFRRKPRTVKAEEKAFWLVARGLFNQRRKNLRNGLKSIAPFAPKDGRDWADVLEEAGIDYRRRPETLSLADFAAIVETAGYTV